jgi:DNA-binding NarL/FixJ family response regulator
VEALACVLGAHFDLVLMDWQMPELDGIETTRRIREMEKTQGGHVTIVAMTANALPGDRERCLAAGMDGYIAKPIQTGDLLQAVGGKAAAFPVPGSQPAAAQGFDYAAALASAEREVLDVLSELFLEQCPASLDEIAAAIAAGDSATLERSAHALKGLLGYFRAVPAQQAARGLEELGSRGRAIDGAEPLARLRAEIENLRPHLAAYVMPH